MIVAPLTPHGRASVLILSRRLARALADRALDPAADLTPATRRALLDIVAAVDEAACRAAGVEPPDPETRAASERGLSDPENARPPPD